MSDDRSDERRQEIKKFERERDWIPLLLAGSVGIYRHWYEGATVSLSSTDWMIFGGILMLLWAVLDLRVMMVRHHWATLRK